MPKHDILIGIDIGTSSTRVVAFDLRGKTLASSTAAYPLLTPKPNWAEQHPDHWWEASRKGLKAVSRQIDPGRVRGISFSGQMHGSVFLDGAGKVIRPALLWCDGRTAAECAEAMDTVGRERFLAIIKNPSLTSFTLPKVLWLRRHEPKNFARLRHILLPKDYVRFRLTGELALDVADGAGTAMMAVGEKRWAGEVLAALGLDPKLLPPILESSAIAGSMTPEAARATGLRAGTPIVAGAGDQPAGATGVGVIEEGQMMVSLGTSGVIFAPTRRAILDPTLALATFDHAAPGVSYLMGCILSAGGALQWHRNELCQLEQAEAKKKKIEVYDLLLDRASKTPIGAEGLFFLPYLMGERSPHNNPNARGAWIGLSIRHGKPHLTRAVVEGVTFALRDCLEAVRTLKVEIAEVRATGGGARSPFWMQMLSDVFGVRVNCVESAEGPALGAAILAGVGTGAYPDFKTAARQAVRMGRSYKPTSKGQRDYQPVYEKFRTLYPALKPHFDRAEV